MLTIRHHWVLRGPNIWAHFPVIELRLELGAIKDTSSDEIPGFNDRLKSWLPSLIEHRCSIGERGGFFQRLDRGTYMAHILEHVTLELQTLAGTPVGYGRARETDEDGVYRVAIEYQEESLGLAAIALARKLLLAAIQDHPCDVTGGVERLRELCHDLRLGPSTTAIAEAARARQIPVRRLGADNLLQLGWGRYQRRVWTAETDRTGAIAEAIAKDKELTRRLLAAVGVPVPEGRDVASAEDAWQFTQELGAPVVIKPRDGNHGRGVTANLTSRESIIHAFAAAREEGSSILCERYINGADHRLLVVGGRLVAAARREPAQVTGDGQSSIRELVAATNRDPRRSAGHATMLSLIELDATALAVLAEQGLTPDSAPAAGQRILLRHTANLSTGGTATDVTDQVHPAVAARALDAAQMVGLDLAGIDILAADISQPLEAQGGAIVEVNAGPGLRMHLEPSTGQPRPVGAAIVELLFPDDATSRIPVIAITGTGATATARLIARLLAGRGDLVGLATVNGLFVGERCIDPQDSTDPEAARRLLMNPRLDSAVLGLAAGAIRREGLGFDRCQVGIVTGIGATSPVAQPGIETLDALAQVKRCVLEAVLPDGVCVLNATDPQVVGMANACPSRRIWFSSAASALLADQLAQGDWAVLEREGSIMLAIGETVETLLSLTSVDPTQEIEPLLAAVAAVWGLGLSPELIRAGVKL